MVRQVEQERSLRRRTRSDQELSWQIPAQSARFIAIPANRPCYPAAHNGMLSATGYKFGLLILSTLINSSSLLVVQSSDEDVNEVDEEFDDESGDDDNVPAYAALAEEGGDEEDLKEDDAENDDDVIGMVV